MIAETRIARGRYKDVEAIVLQNDLLAVTVLPEWGSKIPSMVYKPLGHEILWQNPGDNYRRSIYAAPYPTGEFSGFDEMFPTISECCYEKFPWQGTVLPDHGEVWALPWTAEVSGSEVVLRVNGVRLPYLLTKRLSLVGAVLQVRYSASNLSPFPLTYLWAAHPLFNTIADMEFIVPPGMDRIVNAVAGLRLPDYGGQYGFPMAEVPGQLPLDLSRTPAQNRIGYQKYYFAGKVSEGWCAMYREDLQLAVALAYPKEQVPYLGIWLNEGGYDGQYNIAPEPASAAMDRPDFAAMWGTGSVLAPGETRSWHLYISVATGKRPTTVREDGLIL